MSSPDRPDIAVVAGAGDIDVTSAPELSGQLDAALREGGGGVVVDLARVTFIDSTGLSVLLNAERRMTRARRPLALVVEGGPVARALAASGLDWTFQVFPTMEAAVEWLSARSGDAARRAG